MRRFDKLITDSQIIEKILNESSICRIGFSVDGEAHIIPVNFGYRDNKLFIHSATDGRKIDFIMQNNRVCFEMELDHEIITGKAACDWTTKYRSIIGYGYISIIDDSSQKKAGLDIIMSKYGGPNTNTYSEKILKKMVLLVIEIDTLSGKQSGEWED
ncbi:MAG: pyridoxamine 5'-phosphate oxidase family protein [Marinilabiliales bacterium]|nr:MAG: pyridoxamine 5'-phosphate oxidase family protein [Marinilabiliales bacterium]